MRCRCLRPCRARPTCTLKCALSVHTCSPTLFRPLLTRRMPKPPETSVVRVCVRNRSWTVLKVHPWSHFPLRRAHSGPGRSSQCAALPLFYIHTLVPSTHKRRESTGGQTSLNAPNRLWTQPANRLSSQPVPHPIGARAANQRQGTRFRVLPRASHAPGASACLA